MSIKSIVALADGRDLAGVLNVAVALSTRLAAYLTVLHIKREPYDMIPIGIDGLSGDVIEEIAESARKVIEENRVRAKAEYDRICAPSGQSVTWKEVVGRPSKMMTIASCFADLLVLPQPDDTSPDILFEAADTALFESGRPLVFPGNAPPLVGDHIMIAWNGSTQAARAATAALPLLQLASQVDIVQAGQIGKDVSGRELTHYLALHGVKAQMHALDSVDTNVSGTLLAAAERFGSDLIVMGAYGHSRLRERVLGGVTRDLLKDNHRPVFMMH